MYGFELLWPLSHEPWTPFEAVNIYKQFYVLDALMDSYMELEVKIRNRYYDEFK